MEKKALIEQTRHSEQVYDGVLLKVYRDVVKLPNGKSAIREWIDHPGASAVVPIFDSGEVLLLRQFRYPSRRVFIEVPAGKLDHPGEDPETVARRELEEETGWKAHQWTYLGPYYPCIGYSNEVIHLYLAEQLEQGTAHTEEEEFVLPFKIPFEQAIEMVQRAAIDDMKSALALLLAKAYLENRNSR